MSKVRIKWNAERFLSLSAMTISFITLLIFVYQTNLMRKQNYLSILPYLMLSTTDQGSEQTFELHLKNHGVGPAIIESVTIEYKSKTHDLADYEDDLFLLLASIVPELDSIKNRSSSTLNKGMAIPANSDYHVFSVQNSPESYQLITQSLDRLLHEGLTYRITYRSIQNERWMIHNTSEGPEKLR